MRQILTAVTDMRSVCITDNLVMNDSLTLYHYFVDSSAVSLRMILS